MCKRLLVFSLQLYLVFSVNKWRDLEIRVKGHSRSLKIVSFERLGTVSYSHSIATMVLSCIISEIKWYIGRKSSFLPRDAMHKRGLCCHAVSVRLSVTFVDHVKTNKDIFEIFSPSGTNTILVFLSQRQCRYSDGNLPYGGVECKGVW